MLLLSATIGAGADETISLALPIKCQVGVACFIQNYVDHDVSGKVRDYSCGRRSYDGHDGTDIRIRNQEIQRQGVEVLAAAPGRVIGMRNDMEDVSIRTAGKAAIAGKECGNGALIKHDNDWATQYCHLAKGSVRLKVGDTVTTGQPIGLVGLSGDTEFLHLHFTVRYHGKAVDPFAFGATEKSCGGGRSLWAASLAEQMQYRPREIIDFGFAALAPTMEQIESGEVDRHPVTAGADALVAYVRTIGLQAGDRQSLAVQGPAGFPVATNDLPALDRDKAQFLVIAGKKRTEAAWPAGRYTATYRVTRDGAEVLRKTFDVEARPR
ncbi:M23 family metallopeptidase [Bradyrhizobium sp. BWA-3-5]|uniref:M23 family metallopeptidase n=1 Tax=Bradyrhizobium sp. BWA-3-5 TaxID=3080013 RepID=UPI00293ED20F|nr:M23 family metallopeptidase [Bradyrhizobium sp. BWA-3-5]WOH67737.1 M23 family metallopeptidase [Bradyrhizobium sp. BWA-3-5]